MNKTDDDFFFFDLLRIINETMYVKYLSCLAGSKHSTHDTMVNKVATVLFNMNLSISQSGKVSIKL
jgi:hypothetical protein